MATTDWKHLINQLLAYRVKLLHPAQRHRGFTLIELLVALIISVLVVTGLLSFVTSISQTERRELSKANAQQDIQDAVDFMVRDLQEAVYIYDANGLSGTGVDGIADNIPPTVPGNTTCTTAATCQPVLAFWKRRPLDRCDSLPGVVAANRTRVGIVTGQAFATASRPATAALDSGVQCLRGNSTFVYSLVVYYLIRDADATPSATWSRAARIGRFEIRDGVQNPQATTDAQRFGLVPAIPPDDGFFQFRLPTLTADSTINLVRPSMNEWKNNIVAADLALYPNANQPYPANSLQILTDFIDDTPIGSAQHTAVLNNLMPIPVLNTGATTTNPGPSDLACRNPNQGAMGTTAVRVPRDLTAGVNLSSFYACVNTEQSSVRIYLRGNALARSSPRILRDRRPVTTANISFLPTAEARVFGRGFFVRN